MPYDAISVKSFSLPRHHRTTETPQKHRERLVGKPSVSLWKFCGSVVSSFQWLTSVEILKMGRNSAITMPPMTTPRMAMTIGSIRLVNAVMAASTSFS